ncbi:MAG TPA: serine/threonine-protein kinase [Ktedonobacteraceae bacterium]|jgi:serine/threonine protein kinase
MQNQPPQNFGKYTVIRLIATGGFAEVYLVEDEHGQRWALKRIRQDHELIMHDSAAFRERFEREARAHMGLKHPHIVGVHDFDARESYLVMDYVEGRTLQTLLNEDYPEGMKLETILKLLEPLEEALTYLHRDKKLIHLDLSPKNILLRERRQVRRRGGETEWDPQLADFGLAHIVDLKGKAQGGTSLVWGTPEYKAPEQDRPGPQTPGVLSDIYSLGLMIGVMATGRRPQEVLALLRGMDTTISPERLPAAVKRVLQRATEQDPERRYAAVKGLVTALTQAIEEAVDQPLAEPAHSDPEKTQTAPVVGNASSDPGNWPRSRRPDFPRKIVAAGARLMLQSLVIGALLLTVGILVWVLPFTHTRVLGGLDLGPYCQSLHYTEFIGGPETFSCSAPVASSVWTTLCSWQYGRTDLTAGSLDSGQPKNPYSQRCYDSQRNDRGGLDLGSYCSGLYSDASHAILEGTTIDNWACQQTMDMTAACRWKYPSHVGVQARYNEGTWSCYALFFL